MGRSSGEIPWTRRIRVASGLALLPTLALVEPARTAAVMAGLIRSGRLDGGRVAATERRFQAVRGVLPSRGVIGYRAGGTLRVGRNHELEGSDRPIAQYVFAQYVLAPRVLDLGASGPAVLRDDLDSVRVSGPAGPAR